ncbi:hypothetical protein FNYG_02921 [Fusarium nygamai]|uniref:Major facilitator superfamily (MFS) profile domain-containing protein n=1 Tax=Gibberella nygamai TaxID=42673 RepID=A0A2K0WN62_GIBNY|nr:hypothetical protein FNYG_02921 [Fusarium nygamai]
MLGSRSRWSYAQQPQQPDDDWNQLFHDEHEGSRPTKKSQARYKRFWGVMSCISVLTFITSVDGVVVASVLPKISEELDATTETAFWCGTGFLMTQAIVPPLYGSFSEVFGRKACILVAVGVFLIASILFATAQNIAWLVAARVAQGIGAGGLVALSPVIVTDMVDLRDRAKYSGSFSLVGALGLIAGNFIGPAFAEHISWRWVFWINVPLCIGSAAGLFFCLRLQSTKKRFAETARTMDWLGMVIMVVAVTLLLTGITTGGVLSPWRSAQTIGFITGGVVGVFVFVVHEGCYAKMPFFPLRIFGNRTAASAFSTIFMHGYVVWTLSYVVILYFLGSRGHNLSQSAIDTLPSTGTLAPFAALAGFLISYTKRFQKVIWASWAISISGCILLSLMKAESPLAAQYGPQILVSLGLGPLFPARMMAVQASAAPDDVPIATSSVAFIMGLGQAFGVGVSGSVFQNTWNVLLESRMSKVEFPAKSGKFSIPDKYVIRGNEAQDAAFLYNHGDFPQELQHFYRSLNSDSIGRVMLTLTAISGVAFLLSLLMENLSLDKDSHSSQKFVDADDDTEALLLTHNPR